MSEHFWALSVPTLGEHSLSGHTGITVQNVAVS